AGVLHGVLELPGAAGAGVGGKDALLGAAADGAQLGVVIVADVADDVFGRDGQQYLLAGTEKSVQSGPVVGDQGGAAGGGFKKPDRGRVAGENHVAAGDIQGEPGRRIKAAVPARIQVNDASDIGRPANARGILRTGNDEFAVRQEAGGPAEEFLDLGLPVGSEGSHIAQIAGEALVQRKAAVVLGIE